MKSIFDPITIGSLSVKNRIIRSATLEVGGAEDGVITPLRLRIGRTSPEKRQEPSLYKPGSCLFSRWSW